MKTMSSFGYLFTFVYTMVFRQLGYTDILRIQFMVDASTIPKGNKLVPFISDQTFRFLRGFQVNKPSYIVVFIKEVSDLKFFHFSSPIVAWFLHWLL